MSNGSSEIPITIYTGLVELVTHAENIRWGRLNTLLTMSSIMITAWAIVFAAPASVSLKKTLLTVLCVPGILLGPAFSLLGRRSSDFLDLYYELALQMEHFFPENAPRPFLAGQQIRQEVARKRGKHFTSSRWLLRAIPLLFTSLFTFLMVLSCL
ncbi:MAG: hypothetical protein QXI12_07490 [Candidatus Methanomethyliaceae archaeon]